MEKKPISRRGLLRGAFRSASSSAQTAVLPFYDEQGYTPNTHFYRQQLRHIPQILPIYWMLRLHGLVEKSLYVSYDDLRVMPSIEQSCTLACLGSTARNPMIGNALWRGVPMRGLLEQLNVAPTAKYAQLHAADGYTTYLETDILGDALLAYEMNGESLPPEHGFPVRLVVPGRYGYKMPKWIQRIEFTEQPTPGFWELRGWSPTAEVQTTSTIFTPRHLETVGGMVQLAGVAFAGDREITGVEISINDADWMPVTISPNTTRQWTTWNIDWTPPAPGDYRIRVRATDSIGATQSNDALHSIIIRVVE